MSHKQGLVPFLLVTEPAGSLRKGFRFASNSAVSMSGMTVSYALPTASVIFVCLSVSFALPTFPLLFSTIHFVEYVLPTVVFVVASRTADAMGGVGRGGEIEGAVEMVARSVGQLGPRSRESKHILKFKA